MAGRIKRIRLAYFRRLTADIARREREYEERVSAQEWHRTGIDGVCGELQGILGGSANGWIVCAEPDYATDTFTVGIRYRGNGVGVHVDKREIRLHRQAALKYLAAEGWRVSRMPCRHARELKRRRPPMPATFSALLSEELYCPDCEAVVDR
jgi:hypothetical protein